MFLDPYFSRGDGGYLISADQGSRFAKQVAGDFNPIHDTDSKRFCVPGDLLFGLVLGTQGLNRRMSFRFAGMLGPEVALEFAEPTPDRLKLQDANGKTYLEVERDGEETRAPDLIERLATSYVQFSGHNFPHILVPLMRGQGVMINPQRPLVVYESMSFELQRLDLQAPALKLVDSRLEVNGKRGDARLYFSLEQEGETVGSGFKKLVLSGLREYQPDLVQDLVDRYAGWKAAYEAD